MQTERDSGSGPGASGRAADGVIVLDKPHGITSARALDHVRRITGQRKSGHAGTLDPAATGVLMICLGKATKRVEQLMALPKEYAAEARLDITSDSFDSEGPTRPVVVERIPDEADVRAVFAAFVGVLEQVPPALSAVKVGGRPAYRAARQGQSVALRPRRVRIDHIEVKRYEWPVVAFHLRCGRGTYVRALVRDAGQHLRTGGCLTALRRLGVGPFTCAQAVTLDQLRGAGDWRRFLIELPALEKLLADAAES